MHFVTNTRTTILEVFETDNFNLHVMEEGVKGVDGMSTMSSVDLSVKVKIF